MQEGVFINCTSIINETRFSSSGNYYVQTSRLNQNQGSFSRFGANLWNAIPEELRQLSKGAFKKHFHHLLLSIMETEDDYVEVPILLQKKRKICNHNLMH